MHTYVDITILYVYVTISIFNLSSDKKVEMFTELVQLFNKAWLLLKNQLINYGEY